MPTINSAHNATNPRERASDITATGINTITATSTIPLQAKLSTSLPPLIFGTATFNHQFNANPYALDPQKIVAEALSHGIRAFDTSPYYGPAESILGDALHSYLIRSSPALKHLRREDYFLLTKCGRVAGDEFDYSEDWIRFSVRRSCRRLKTKYLDVVYLHDVEFVSSAEVLQGVLALRKLRDEGLVRYIGICGYPVDVLASLSELVLRETNEAIDIVQSYANLTVQNQRLGGVVERFVTAGVDVVTNASPLGMGLCRSQGVPLGNSSGQWHPAPDGLRSACLRAADQVSAEGEKLEVIALRFAMEKWLSDGAQLGSSGILPDDATAVLGQRSNGDDQTDKHEEQTQSNLIRNASSPRMGVSVMGVSRVSELEETMMVYRNIIASHASKDNARRQYIETATEKIRNTILGQEWTDFAWNSPEPGFINKRKTFGVSGQEMAEEDAELEIAAALEDVAYLKPTAKGVADVSVGEIVITEEDLVCPVTGMKGKMPGGHAPLVS